MYARACARNSDTHIKLYEHLIKQYEHLIKQYEHLIKQFEYMKHPRDLRGCLCLMSNHYPESGDWFAEKINY